MNYDLRPYQRDAIRAINDHWEEWDRELLVLPTGCGKTVVFNTIASQRSGNTLILAHRDELIEQARDKYYKMFGQPAGKIKGAEANILPVTVGSIQTMARRDYAGCFDTVIVDEAHHALSEQYQNVLAQFPSAKVLGVTATPDRGDKRSLAQYFDGIAYEYGLRDAIKDGYLCEITAKTVPLEIDMSDIKVSVGDFEVNSIAAILEPYLPRIAEAIQTHACNRKTVVFCPLISIAQELAGLIPGAMEVNGTSPDRKEIIEAFDKAKPGAVLCNAMLLTEGWDCPSCDCVVVLRPTKIRSLYCQMVGRGTRLFPGKKNLLLLDFLWMTYKHNLCKPASLLSDNDEDIKRVTEQSICNEDDIDISYGELDLMEAVSDAEEARRNALAKELERQQKKKSKMINPIELFSILADIGISDYEPTFDWEMAEATQKQIKALEKFGVDADGVTKGYAAYMLGRLINRSEENLCTLKQARILHNNGYPDAHNWTFEQANRKISALAAVGWKRWKLRD